MVGTIVCHCGARSRQVHWCKPKQWSPGLRGFARYQTQLSWLPKQSTVSLVEKIGIEQHISYYVVLNL